MKLRMYETWCHVDGLLIWTTGYKLQRSVGYLDIIMLASENLDLFLHITPAYAQPRAVKCHCCASVYTYGGRMSRHCYAELRIFS